MIPAWNINRDEWGHCPHCGRSRPKEDLEWHKEHCGYNPAFVNKLRESGIIGRMFFKFHPRSGSTEYYFVDSVQMQEAPVIGYLIRIPGPSWNPMASRSYSFTRRNRYVDSELEPSGWSPCSAEEGQEALRQLKEFVNGGGEGMTSASKEFKMHRSTADRLLKGLTERIAWYNGNFYKPYFVERAVVFGSYVNAPERQMLSDLDIGIKLSWRYSGKIAKTAFEIEYDDVLERCPSYRHREEYPFCLYNLTYDDALRFLRKRSHYISFHPIGEDAAIFSDVTLEIDVGDTDRDTEWYDELQEWYR